MSRGTDDSVNCYHLGRQPYLPVWQAMRWQIDAPDIQSREALWTVEHPPVLTLGRNARREHVLRAGAVPLVSVDRGGQVTAHEPGQIVVYPLLDLERHGLGVRSLVTLLETAVIRVVARLGVTAKARPDAPGVYVGDAKLAAIGLRIRHRFSMHGIAVNVRNPLGLFERIHPCGYPGLVTTSLQRLGVLVHPWDIGRALEEEITQALGQERNPHNTLPAMVLRALALRNLPAPGAARPTADIHRTPPTDPRRAD